MSHKNKPGNKESRRHYRRRKLAEIKKKLSIADAERQLIGDQFIERLKQDDIDLLDAGNHPDPAYTKMWRRFELLQTEITQLKDLGGELVKFRELNKIPTVKQEEKLTKD